MSTTDTRDERKAASTATATGTTPLEGGGATLLLVHTVQLDEAPGAMVRLIGPGVREPPVDRDRDRDVDAGEMLPRGLSECGPHPFGTECGVSHRSVPDAFEFWRRAGSAS